MKIKSEVVAALIVLPLVLLIAWGSWHLKRWANWKFGYGPKVEQRIELLEKRVEQLEKR